jgi:parafibromin
MSSEEDPLIALRQSIKSKSKVGYSNTSGPCPTLIGATSLIINSKPFPKSIRTRFHRGAGANDFYALDAVYVAWLLRDAPGAEYMKQAREHGLAVGFVSVTERKQVVDWLEGKVQDSDRIAPLSGAYIFLIYFIVC